jgi:hypothetical protein
MTLGHDPWTNDRLLLPFAKHHSLQKYNVGKNTKHQKAFQVESVLAGTVLTCTPLHRPGHGPLGEPQASPQTASSRLGCHSHAHKVS